MCSTSRKRKVIAEKVMTSTLLTFACLAEFSIALAAGWNYDFNSANGPSNWPPPCSNGTEQSPIDIFTTTATYDPTLGDFTLVNYANTPPDVNFTATNKGKGLEISFDSHMYNVSGGGLTGIYTTVQFHLHWGSSNDNGSEHTMDGMMYPAEIDFVSYNTKYPNIVESLSHSDGLAVLGVFLQVGSGENQAYKKFLNQISYVKNMSGESREFSAFPLMSLLPTDKTKYYRYPGSLTTPNCQEAVIWTVFKDPVEISQAQLDGLRSMKYNDTMNIVNNYRPVQMLNSRQVKASFDMITTAPPVTTTAPPVTTVAPSVTTAASSVTTTAPSVTTDGVALKISNVVLLLVLLLGAAFFHLLC